jgi:N-acetylmuramoyl-L-alanine amidase
MRRAVVCLIALALLASCGSGSKKAASTTTTTSTTTSTSSTTTTGPPTTTTSAPGYVWPAITDDGVARALQTPGGLILPVKRDNGDGSYVVETPCEQEATTAGTPISGANVVLDPGHGGAESGAVGPAGTEEKTVNLEVASDAKQLLEQSGASVVLTRTGDYNPSLKVRADLALALKPQVFLSVHHNAEPDGPSDVPGNEDYYQIKSDDSKRLAGILWEEITKAFTPYKIAWTADTDHGAKYRLGTSGGDYYGILRDAAGITTVLSEAAFITNPPEEQLLNDPDFRHKEAQAIANAITRFLATPDPGSGYVTPYPRDEVAGGGGGTAGCVDPPL